MTRIKKNSSQLYVFTVVLVTLLIGFLFYILNYYTPLFADDYSYSFSFATGERLSTVNQIIDSQIVHYQNTNGRSITHSLAQLFLLAGDDVFNFVNVIFFLLLIYLIYFHVSGSVKNFSLTRFSIITMLLFLSCPAFGQSFLWITGASNYLYGIFIILCVLLPYRLQVNGDNVRYPLLLEIIASIVYLFLGIIAGWTNENTSVAMIVMMISYTIYFHIKSIKIHVWNITGCIGGTIGCIIMLSAPGIARRLDKAGGSGGIFSWLKRLIVYTCDIFVNLHLVLLLLSVLMILYLYQKRHQLIKCSFKEAVILMLKESGIPLIYFLGFLASVYSMIVSPEFPGRTWSGPVILSIIAVVHFSSMVDMPNINGIIGKKVTLVFLLVLCVSTYTNALVELRHVNEAYHERVSIIENAISSGEKNIEIPSIYGWSGYSCYSASGDLEVDSSKWPNTAIASYYGVEKIICTD